MLRMFDRVQNKLVPVSDPGKAQPLWIDLMEPSNEEVVEIEKLVSLAIPTRDEMEEIELSSRLYTEDDATFLTMTALSQLDTETPIKSPFTFIVKNRKLITVRYADPKPLAAYLARAQRDNGAPCASAEEVMLGILEAMVDRIADALERSGNDIDTISRAVFKKGTVPSDKKTRNLANIISEIGSRSEYLTIILEGLVSMSRLVAYYSASEDPSDDSKETRYLLKVLQRDTGSLGEHARSLSTRLAFLLDATLGLINLEQNQIIKIFSVAAVVFLPPTLVASIYGMNFDHMPELAWLVGYPWALGLMVLSAVLPFLYFKRKGWL